MNWLQTLKKASRILALPPEWHAVINDALPRLQQLHEQLHQGEKSKELIYEVYHPRVSKNIDFVDPNHFDLHISIEKDMTRPYAGSNSWNSAIVNWPYDEWHEPNIRSTLEHELTHVLDPKLWYGEGAVRRKDPSRPWAAPKNWKDTNIDTSTKTWSEQRQEFDAVSTDVAGQLLRLIEKDYIGVNEVYNWLRTGDTSFEDKWSKLNPKFSFMTHFWKSDPILWRRFRSRIYNVLQENQQPFHKINIIKEPIEE